MSIADALREVKTKIDNVYKALENAGATIPEDKNLDNLTFTIESKPSAETVMAYYNGADITEGKKVLLTNVGYTLSGSDTFSPKVRPCVINENGFVITAIGGNYRYQIVNGVVDESTKTSVSGLYTLNATHFFMLNGAVSVVNMSPTMTLGQNSMDLYTLTNSARISGQTSTSYKFLDWGVCDAKYNGDITVVNEDLTTEKIELKSYLSGAKQHVYVFGPRDLFYVVYDSSSSSSNSVWNFAKLEKIDGSYVATTLKPSITETPKNPIVSTTGLIFVNTKTKVQTATGEVYHCLCNKGFVYVEINKQDETQSEFGGCSYPQNILDVMGDRTIAVIQTFYDGTFSLCLSEGTTLICKFISATEVEILQVIEPFIVEGDSTVYYRNFTATKMFWWQISSKYAPISAKPCGPFNAEKAITNWVALNPTGQRFNSTVLTGFLTGESTVEDGRQLVEVRTALPE